MALIQHNPAHNIPPHQRSTLPMISTYALHVAVTSKSLMVCTSLREPLTTAIIIIIIMIMIIIMIVIVIVIVIV